MYDPKPDTEGVPTNDPSATWQAEIDASYDRLVETDPTGIAATMGKYC
jgi:hypothetical protein